MWASEGVTLMKCDFLAKSPTILLLMGGQRVSIFGCAIFVFVAKGATIVSARSACSMGFQHVGWIRSCTGGIKMSWLVATPAGVAKISHVVPLSR